MLAIRVITVPIHTVLLFNMGEDKYKYGMQEEEEVICGVGLVGILVWTHNLQVCFSFVHGKELGAMIFQEQWVHGAPRSWFF